jgi:hypothetical protein
MPAALSVAVGDEDVIGALEVMGALVVDEAFVLEPLELHAARPALRASAATAAGTRRRVVRTAVMGKSLLDDQYDCLLASCIRRLPRIRM